MGSRVSGEDYDATDAGSAGRRGNALSVFADRAAFTLAAMFGIAVGFLALNQPWVSDDFGAAAFLRDHPALWDSVVSGYTTWTGRFAGSVFSWLVLQIRPVYGIVIWLGLALLVTLTFAVARARLPRFVRADLYAVALIAIAYWYGLPALEETVFWTAGSVVYLWPAVAALAFLYPYRVWGEGIGNLGRDALLRVGAAAGMFALGVCVGGSQEQLLAACLLYLGILGLRAGRSGRLRQIPAHLYAGAVGLVAAGVVSVTAPGNAVRLDAIPDLGPGGTALAAVKFLVHMGVEWLSPLAPWLMILAVLAVPVVRMSSQGQHVDRRAIRSDWPIWVLLGLATVTPFLVQPYFGAERTVMFVAVLLTVAAVSLGGDGSNERLLDRVPAYVASSVIAVLLLMTVGDVVLSGAQARSLSAGQRARAGEIRRQKEAGIVDVAVRPISTEAPRRGVIWGDGTADATFWVNEVMASYYGVNTITVTDAAGAPAESPQ